MRPMLAGSTQRTRSTAWLLAVALVLSLCMARAGLAQACGWPLRRGEVPGHMPSWGFAYEIVAVPGGVVCAWNVRGGLYFWDGSARPARPLLPTWFTTNVDSVIGFERTLYFSAGGRLYSVGTDGRGVVRDHALSMSDVPLGCLSELGGRTLVAGRGAAGEELFAITPGDPIAWLVKDINPSGSSSPRSFVRIGDRMFFYATTPATGYEPWVTDGTQTGTVMLGDLNTGPGDSSFVSSAGSVPSPEKFPAVMLRDRLYFVAKTGTPSLSLFSTDGTPSGTRRIDLGAVHPGRWLARAGTRLVFGGLNAAGLDLGRVYASDGTLGGTTLLRDFVPSRILRALTQSGDLVFFVNPIASAEELWVTDGTPEGTNHCDLGAPWARSLSLGPVLRGRVTVGLDLTLMQGSTIGSTRGLAGTGCAVQLPASVAASFIGQPGDSALSVRATASRLFWTAAHSDGSLPIVLDLCPADINNTGGDPNAQDIFDFISAFFAGDVSADFNESGMINGQDVVDFLRAWFEGCEP